MDVIASVVSQFVQNKKDKSLKLQHFLGRNLRANLKKITHISLEYFYFSLWHQDDCDSLGNCYPSLHMFFYVFGRKPVWDFIHQRTSSGHWSCG